MFESAFKGADQASSTVVNTSSTQTYGPGDDIPASVQVLMKAALESARLAGGTSATRTYGPGDDIPADVQALVKAALDSANLAGGSPESTAGAVTGARAAKHAVPASSDVFSTADVSGTAKPRSTIESPDSRSSVAPLLGLGIFFLPPIFVWFLLRKEHTAVQRVLGFTWLGLVALTVLAGS